MGRILGGVGNTGKGWGVRKLGVMEDREGVKRDGGGSTEDIENGKGED